MKYLSLLLLTTTLLGGCCQKQDLFPDVAPCMEAHIVALSRSSSCPDAGVREYLFQGHTVYVLDPGTCCMDCGADVLDTKCNYLGSLGGMDGNTRIQGEPFEKAQFIRSVWQR